MLNWLWDGFRGSAECDNPSQEQLTQNPVVAVLGTGIFVQGFRACVLCVCVQYVRTDGETTEDRIACRHAERFQLL